MSTIIILDSGREITAARKFMFHGTSAKHVRSILKQGLVPNRKQKVYTDDFRGSGRSIGTYGGVYITDQFMTAYSSAGQATKRNGESLIVVLDYETRSPDTLIDEDMIIPFITSGLQNTEWIFLRNPVWAAALHPYRAGYGDPFSFDPAKLEEIAEAINRLDLTAPANSALDSMLEQYPALDRRIKELRPQLVPLVAEAIRAYGFHMIESQLDDRRDHAIQKMRKHMKKVLEAEGDDWFAKTPIETRREWVERDEEKIQNLLHPPSEIAESFERLRDTTTALSRRLKEITYNRAKKYAIRQNLRVMTPIGFRGKNRIRAIVGMRGTRAEGRQFIVYYGKSDRAALNAFVKGFEEGVGRWQDKDTFTDRRGREVRA